MKCSILYYALALLFCYDQAELSDLLKIKLKIDDIIEVYDFMEN